MEIIHHNFFTDTYIEISFCCAIEGEDFEVFNSTLLTFATNSSNGHQMCILIKIIDDSILEPMQSFSVALHDTPIFVNTINRSIISIVDNDSK